jgi:hypothetical protein
MGLKPKSPTNNSNKDQDRFSQIKENARKQREIMNRK